MLLVERIRLRLELLRRTSVVMRIARADAGRDAVGGGNEVRTEPWKRHNCAPDVRGAVVST